jgi:RNA polymerase sigma factor for flagellar operon FliA
MTATDNSALWQKYRQTGDIVLRNELIMKYSKLVETVAVRMYGMFSGKAQLEDIIGNGMITLIKAVESFDPSRGIKFETFASINPGSIVDYLRMIRIWVPRTVREKSKRIVGASPELRLALQRTDNRRNSEELKILRRG